VETEEQRISFATAANPKVENRLPRNLQAQNLFQGAQQWLLASWFSF
jgi:hypothetical protein